MIVPGPSSPPITSIAIRITQKVLQGSTGFYKVLPGSFADRERTLRNPVEPCRTLWNLILLGFFDRTDLAALVITAVRADLVRCLRFATLRTRSHRNRA